MRAVDLLGFDRDPEAAGEGMRLRHVADSLLGEP